MTRLLWLYEFSTRVVAVLRAMKHHLEEQCVKMQEQCPKATPDQILEWVTDALFKYQMENT